MQSTRVFDPAKYLSQTDREITAAKRQRDQLDQLIQGLEAARQAMSVHILSHASESRSNGNGSRATILREILEERREPVDVDLIMKELQKRHIDAPRAGVAATLSYLKRQGVATNVDRGKWTALVAA